MWFDRSGKHIPKFVKVFVDIKPMKNQCILRAKSTHDSLRIGHNSWKNPVAVH